jgi:hypothetical protein
MEGQVTRARLTGGNAEQWCCMAARWPFSATARPGEARVSVARSWRTHSARKEEGRESEARPTARTVTSPELRPWSGEEDWPIQPLTLTTAAASGHKRWSCWLVESKNEVWVEEHVADGAVATRGGESTRGISKWRGRRRRQDGVWSDVRLDSLEGGARPVRAGTAPRRR